MENSKDLKAGNYVLHRGEIKPIWQVRYNAVDFLIGFDKNENPFYQSWKLVAIEPIQLSEEILLKCGFVENGDTSQFHLEGQIVSYNKLDGVHFWIMGTDKCIRVKHLHQLQNLYFALTGQELNIEL